MELIPTPAMDHEPFHECCISKIAKYVWISYHILNTTQMLVLCCSFKQPNMYEYHINYADSPGRQCTVHKRRKQ